MWGIVPAAGAGSRIQPLAFSKELLPVGSRFEGRVERPRAVSEYLVERMILGGATRICFVVSPGKSDILEYYGGQFGPAHVCYTVQPTPSGLCDSIFRALPLIREDEDVIVGLPDTIWFPEDALQSLPGGVLSFLLFPVQRPELFDAVVTDEHGRVLEIQVKRADARSSWIWGAFRMPGAVLAALHRLWLLRDRGDEYIGTLVNAFLAQGGYAVGVRAGSSYVDVGTIHGYREAIQLLSVTPPEQPEALLPHLALAQADAIRASHPSHGGRA
jgi:dTDP-glucose pyrophosphorylase